MPLRFPRMNVVPRHRAAAGRFLRLMRFAAIGLATLYLAGCGSVYRSLPPESADPEFGPLVRDLQRNPIRTSHVNVAPAGEPPLRLAIRETSAIATSALDPPQSDRVIVFVPGVISDGRMWRYLQAELGRQYDTMAIDPPGCGTSDPHDLSAGDPDAYTPQGAARAVLGAMSIKLAERPASTKVTLVGHSLGGATILRMYADPGIFREYRDVLEHVDGLVLFAPADARVDINNPMFRELVLTPDWMFSLAGTLGILRERVSEGILLSVVEQNRVPREEADRTIEILKDPQRRRAARMMLIRATPLLQDGQLDEATVERITEGYRNVNVRCRIVWGIQDDVLLEQMGYKMRDRIPRCELHRVTMSKHCLPTERPLVSAELVREVASGDAAGVPGSVYKVDGKSGHAWPEPGLPHNVIAGQSHSTPGAEAVDSYAELASHSEPATASFKTPGPATQPVR